MPGTLVASDNFNRASLGSNWTDQAVSGFGSLQIVSSTQGGNLSANVAAYWNANTFKDDQYAQVTAGSNGGGAYAFGALVRCSTSQPSHYGWVKSDDGAGTVTGSLFKRVNGTLTALGSGATPTTPRLEVIHTVLCAQGATSTTLAVTDSSLASGSTGTYSENATVDSWEGGDVYAIGWPSSVGTNFIPTDTSNFVWWNYTHALPVAGTLTKVWWYGNCLSTDGLSLRAAVYKKGNSGTGSHLLVAESAEVVYSTTQSVGWHEITISGSLDAGETYLVGIAVERGATSPRIFGSSITFGDVLKNASLGATVSWPSNLSTFTGTNAHRYALYAEYTPSGGGAVSQTAASVIELLKSMSRKSSD